MKIIRKEGYLIEKESINYILRTLILEHKKPELIEKSYTLLNQFGPYSLSKCQLSLAC